MNFLKRIWCWWVGHDPIKDSELVIYWTVCRRCMKPLFIVKYEYRLNIVAMNLEKDKEVKE